MTAIYVEDKKISFYELLSMVKEVVINDPIFPVSKSLSCACKILHCLIYNVPFFPYSPNLHEKPSIKIPKGIDMVLHTSGSSKQKYVLLKKSALLQANILTHRDFMLAAGDVYVLNLPLFHIAGIALLLRALLRGAAIAIDPTNTSMITHMSCVSTQAIKLGNKQEMYPNLRALLVGGGPISRDLCESLTKKGYPLYITYGMTEMSSHVFLEKYDPNNGLCFKKPLRKRECCLDDKSVLHLKGAGKFERYIDQNTTEFHNTGDTFALKDGKYYILGRADKMFISGGENIYPEEIQKTLLSHPHVRKVSIVIKDDLKWGNRPYAKIYILSKTITKGCIISFLENRLEKFKVLKPHEIALYY